MKTLKTLLTASLLTSAAFSANVQANNSNALSSFIYEESANIFSEVSYQSSTPTGIISYSDDANKTAVWSSEYEQYVNPADFQVSSVTSIETANRYMGSHPTAAGRVQDNEAFVYNETAGEYHLQ